MKPFVHESHKDKDYLKQKPFLPYSIHKNYLKMYENSKHRNLLEENIG